jgi:hypothetical protein
MRSRPYAPARSHFFVLFLRFRCVTSGGRSEYTSSPIATYLPKGQLRLLTPFSFLPLSCRRMRRLKRRRRKMRQRFVARRPQIPIGPTRSSPFHSPFSFLSSHAFHLTGPDKRQTPVARAAPHHYKRHQNLLNNTIKTHGSSGCLSTQGGRGHHGVVPVKRSSRDRKKVFAVPFIIVRGLRGSETNM